MYKFRNTTFDTTTTSEILKSVTTNNKANTFSPIFTEGFKCGETITSKEYKPYFDKNLSAIKVTEKFYNDKFEPITKIYYKNVGSNISKSKLEKYFNNKINAFWTNDVSYNKYVVKLIDEKNSITVDTKKEAIELLSNKCKDKATIAGKLIYSEYDACKNNNTIQDTIITQNEQCGKTKVKLSYYRGLVSDMPNQCNYNASWTYGRF